MTTTFQAGIMTPYRMKLLKKNTLFPEERLKKFKVGDEIMIQKVHVEDNTYTYYMTKAQAKHELSLLKRNTNLTTNIERLVFRMFENKTMILKHYWKNKTVVPFCCTKEMELTSGSQWDAFYYCSKCGETV